MSAIILNLEFFTVIDHDDKLAYLMSKSMTLTTTNSIYRHTYQSPMRNASFNTTRGATSKIRWHEDLLP